MSFSSAARALLGGRPLRNAAISIAGITWLDLRLDRWRADRRAGTTTHLKRIVEGPRTNWAEKAFDSGLTFATLPGVSWGHASGFLCEVLPPSLCQWFGLQEPYWNESASYQVSDEGMWRIEKAAFEMHSLILEAVDEVVESEYLLESFGIPRELWPVIRLSWKNRESDLLGRLDFLWDGEGEPKLAEYNADTPTVLIEAAAAQRDWHKEKRPEYGQFNVLDEAILDAWRKVALEDLQQASLDLPRSITLATQGASFWNDPKAFGASDSTWRKYLGLAIDTVSKYSFEEEAATGRYLHQLAVAATSDLKQMAPPKLVDFDSLQSSDLGTKHQGALFKLYPWEWLIFEDIGEDIRFDAVMGDPSGHFRRRVLEPPVNAGIFVTSGGINALRPHYA